MFRLPPPYLWTPLSPQRVKGCSPLTIPKKKSKPKNASRFAKRIFLCFSHLRLRRRFYLSAELHALRGRNTSCEAANRRNEKKALSAATSFFPFRQLLRGLKGASSPFLATATTAASGGNREELLGQRPAGCERQRSRRWEPQPVGSSASKSLVVFWFSFGTQKRTISLNEKALSPAHRRATPLKRKRANVPHGTLALSPHLCAAAVGMRTVYSMYPSRSSRCAVAGTPLSVIRRMAWSMVFTKMRTSFTIEMR